MLRCMHCGVGQRWTVVDGVEHLDLPVVCQKGGYKCSDQPLVY